MACLHVVGELDIVFNRPTKISDIAMFLKCSKYKARKVLQRLEELGYVYMDRMKYHTNAHVHHYHVSPLGKLEFDSSKTKLPYKWVASYHTEVAK
jgi:predicted transcriptional regulator